MTTSINEYRTGLTAGARSEFIALGDVIPGHEGALRQTLAGQKRAAGIQEALKEIGTLHEARFALLDGDTRLMFASSFDGPWDTYIDDFARTDIGQAFDDAWRHVQGFPGVKDPHVKEWFKDHTVVASSYHASYPEPTTKQIWRALAVQEAFQQVVDDPAAEVLQHPVLEQAAD